MIGQGGEGREQRVLLVRPGGKGAGRGQSKVTGWGPSSSTVIL